ncbi:MAG: hypothetical protein FPO08_04005 [Geobacter sp.]|nr:MAG: hypothetical protein FPO08_04005 [Geobacter sp.]
MKTKAKPYLFTQSRKDAKKEESKDFGLTKSVLLLKVLSRSSPSSLLNGLKVYFAPLRLCVRWFENKSKTKPFHVKPQRRKESRNKRYWFNPKAFCFLGFYHIHPLHPCQMV